MTHHSFANYYPERTITTTGLSKWCGAGGWRFGAALLSDGISLEMKQTLIGIGSETYSCAPSPVQIAAKEAYVSFRDRKRYIQWQTSILSLVGNECANNLNDAKIRTFKPQGGFYLFPDFSLHEEKLQGLNVKNSNDLCQLILKEIGVVILPGMAFGMSENDLVARLAYVDFDAPKEYSNFVIENHAPKVLLGIKLLTEWIENI
jgi:aspartate aminotransferase